MSDCVSRLPLPPFSRFHGGTVSVTTINRQDLLKSCQVPVPLQSVACPHETRWFV
jgi:hypothetical protein